MATYYFDPILGSNTTGTGSLANPWANYDGKLNSTAAGDTLLFKRGTTQVVTSLYLGVRSGTAGNRTRYKAYGEGADPVFTNPSGLGNMILNGSNAHDVIFEDIDFNTINCANTIYFASQSGGNVYNITTRRCTFRNSSGSGFGADREGTSNGLVYNIIVEDCVAHDNAAHGIVLTGTGCRISRCHTYRNGATVSWGGHGISMLYSRSEVTTGWSGSGPYSRAIVPTGATVYFVSYGSSFLRLTENTTTPTTPSLNQFGQSGGNLYINVGENPDGKSTNYAWGECKNNVIEDCESHHNFRNLSAPYWEGHGIALDDYTSNTIVRRCYTHDNEGLGFSANRGDNNLFYGNVVINNALPALVVNKGTGNQFYNNTCVNNNLNSSTPYSSEVHSSGDATILYNNCIVSSETNAFYATGTSHGMLYSLTYGVTTPAGGTAISLFGLSQDPVLGADFRPTASSPLVGAGYSVLRGLTGFDKRRFTFPRPTLGAIEARPRVALTRKKA